MKNKQLNYIVFDVNGKVRKSYISNLVATSANQKVFVFNDADITTESTAYRSYARIKRADSFNVGPITLLASEITVENTGYTQDELNKFLESINVDYTSCRILILEKQALAVSGPISITVVYDRVNELGRTIETQAKAEVSAYVYEAVEEIFTEEEYTSIKEEMLPRDLGDVTSGGIVASGDRVLGIQNGISKMIDVDLFRQFVHKYNVIDLGAINNIEEEANNIETRGVYRYEYDDGVYGNAGLLFNEFTDEEELYQLIIEPQTIKRRRKLFKNNYVWEAWESIDIFEIHKLIEEGIISGTLESFIEDKVLDKVDEINPRLLNLEQNKADKAALQAVASGSPKGTYANLAALQSAIPDGNNNIYVTLDNGHWNYYDFNTNEWKSGGIYQSKVDYIRLIFNQPENKTPLDFFKFELRGNKLIGINPEDLERGSWWLNESIKNEIYEEDGNYYLDQSVGRVIFDGTEAWERSETSGYFRLSYVIPDLPLIESYGLIREDVRSPSYNSITGDAIVNGAYGAGFSYYQKLRPTPYIFVRDDRFDNVDDFKAHLSLNNFIVYYLIVNKDEPELLELQSMYVENPKILVENENELYELEINETLKSNEETYDYIDEELNIHIRVDEESEIIREANIVSNTLTIFPANSTIKLQSDTSVLPVLVGLVEKEESAIIMSEVNNKATKQELQELKDYVDNLVIPIEDDLLPFENYEQEEWDLQIPKAIENMNQHTLDIIYVTDTQTDIFEDDVVKKVYNQMRHFDKLGFADLFIHGGDWINNDYSLDTLADIAENNRINLDWQEKLVNKISCDKILVKGNHDDGKYPLYNKNSNLGDLTDEYLITRKEWFRKMLKRNLKGCVFNKDDENGIYYYKDLEDKKVRVICLDMLDVPDGYSINSYYHWFGFSPKQIQWLAHKALNFSDKVDFSEWSVLIVSHMANNSDANYMVNTGFNGTLASRILEAFILGDSLESTSDNENNGNVSYSLYETTVNVDYTSQGEGKVIMWLAGHTHLDICYKPENSLFTYVTSAGAKLRRSPIPAHLQELPEGAVDSPTRTVGTATEMVWDIISIDLVSRTVKITRFGAGNDREFTY